jgi:hypothetical protein
MINVTSSESPVLAPAMLIPFPRQARAHRTTAERVCALYRRHYHDPRKEGLFLASCSFLVTFVAVRGIVYLIRSGKSPIGNLHAGPKHIHHLVWGIGLLLAVGYSWLAQVGTGLDDSRRWTRLTAVLYGAGSALTLDEFALWLNLKDVYWLPEGRASIDATIMFAALLSVGTWGQSFICAVACMLVSPPEIDSAAFR